MKGEPITAYYISIRVEIEYMDVVEAITNLDCLHHVSAQDTLVFKKDYAEQISYAIQWIYDIHGWTGRDIAKRITGIAPELWDNYANPNFREERQLHLIAALSWVSQVSMSAIHYGRRIQSYWKDASPDTIEILLYGNLLGAREFRFFISEITAHFPIDESLRDIFFNRLNDMERRHSAPYLAPVELDIDAFAEDYYRSIAMGLQFFRQKKTLEQEEVAKVLGMSATEYQAIENIHQPVKSLPVSYAARFRIGFNLAKTVQFTAQMSRFSGFCLSRTIQEQRELFLLELLSHISADSRYPLVKVVKQLAFVTREFASREERRRSY